MFIKIEKFKDCIITRHAEERYHQRIGNGDPLHEIRTAAKRNGIEHIEKEYFKTDTGLVFVALPKDENICIITILGNVKENPGLNNPHLLKRDFRLKLNKEA